MPLAFNTEMFQNPLFWAVFIGWVLTVVLHEFAHGLVAYMGGDYTIRERGGLTLNPIQYIDPVGSLLLPLVFLALGGIPLPGGVTYVRRDLLRSRGWDAAVSLAGPAMNFLLFLACVLPMHPKLGWVTMDESSGPASVLATLGLLQIVAMLLNLIPVPPLDGFQAIAAFMDEENKAKLLSPQISMISMLLLYTVLWQSSIGFKFFMFGIKLLERMGFGDTYFFLRAYVHVFGG